MDWDAVKGVRLDLGCGRHRQVGAVGVDRRAGPGVDLVWDLTEVPWPIPTGIALTVYLLHVWQEIPRASVPAVMDELWRVCRDGTDVFLTGYDEVDWRWVADPACVNLMADTTLRWWDPRSEWWGAWGWGPPTAQFHVEHYERVPAGKGADYNAIIRAVKA